MTKKILIVSDSHANTTWLNFFDFNEYDNVIHAGDHCLSSKQIAKITPYYVDGNNDWGKQHILKFKINELTFLLTHGDEYLNYGGYQNDKWADNLYKLALQNQADIVVFGHTHIPVIKKINHVTLINPGSVSFSRHNGNKHYIELEIDNNNILSINELKI